MSKREFDTSKLEEAMKKVVQERKSKIIEYLCAKVAYTAIHQSWDYKNEPGKGPTHPLKVKDFLCKIESTPHDNYQAWVEEVVMDCCVAAVEKLRSEDPKYLFDLLNFLNDEYCNLNANSENEDIAREIVSSCVIDEFLWCDTENEIWPWVFEMDFRQAVETGRELAKQWRKEKLEIAERRRREYEEKEQRAEATWKKLESAYLSRYGRKVPHKLEKGNYRPFRELLDELDIPEEEIRNLGVMCARRFSNSVAAEISRYVRKNPAEAKKSAHCPPPKDKARIEVVQGVWQNENIIDVLKKLGPGICTVAGGDGRVLEFDISEDGLFGEDLGRNALICAKLFGMFSSGKPTGITVRTFTKETVCVPHGTEKGKLIRVPVKELRGYVVDTVEKSPGKIVLGYRKLTPEELRDCYSHDCKTGRQVGLPVSERDHRFV